MEGGKRNNKRKGNGFLDQLEAIKKQGLEDPEALDDKVKANITENMAVGKENANDYFERILCQATPADVLSEYFWFLKHIPKLLNNEMSEVLHTVKTNLRVSVMKETKKGQLRI